MALSTSTLTASVAAAYLRAGDTIAFGGAEGVVAFVSTVRPIDAYNAGQVLVDVKFNGETAVTPLWLPADWQVVLTENPIQ